MDVGTVDESIIVNIKDLEYSYLSSVILPGISLSLPSKKIVGISGPSGCGKTTLLRLIGGLLEPPVGKERITFCGEPINDEHTHHIGYMPQNDFLAEYLTAHELLKHYAGIRKLSDPLSVIERLIRQFQLESHQHKRLSEVSVGTRKRISIAVAMLHTPRLLLLDEPTTALDEANVRRVYAFLDGLKAQGVSIVLITHHNWEYNFLDHLIAMNSDGGIEHSGDVESYIGGSV